MDIEREVAPLETYMARSMEAIEKIGFYARDLGRYPFDTIACSMMSKAISLARSCILLLRSNQDDSAYGLSRSVIECALILRYITSDSELQGSRAIEFANFSFDYKDVWIYYARLQFAGTRMADEIEAYARMWHLSGDASLGRKHWSKLRSFTWKAQSMQHPLDGPTFDSVFKEKQYAVDYFQTCQWVHCSQPALDNYVPDERAPFRFRDSSDEFGSPGHSVVYILLNYLHSVFCYALFGLRLDRPGELNESFSDAIGSLTPIQPSRVYHA